MLKYILLISFFVSLFTQMAIGQPKAMCNRTENIQVTCEKITVQACDNLKMSQTCQDVYKRISSQGNDPTDYELKCTSSDLDLSLLEKTPDFVFGCGIGGWDFLKDPFVTIGKGIGHFAAYLALDMEKQKELNQICDQSIENKKKLFETYNLGLPRLLKLPQPQDKYLNQRSCALLKTEIVQQGNKRQRNVSSWLGYKAFQKQPTFSNQKESEYIQWVKKNDTANLTGQTSLAKALLHEMKIRYECYNTTRAAALVCQSIFNLVTLGMATKGTLQSLAGLSKTTKTQITGKASKNVQVVSNFSSQSPKQLEEIMAAIRNKDPKLEDAINQEKYVLAMQEYAKKAIPEYGSVEELMKAGILRFENGRMVSDYLLSRTNLSVLQLSQKQDASFQLIEMSGTRYFRGQNDPAFGAFSGLAFMKTEKAREAYENILVVVAIPVKEAKLWGHDTMASEVVLGDQVTSAVGVRVFKTNVTPLDFAKFRRSTRPSN